MLKVVVIANCQARPIAKYIEEFSSDCKVIEIGIVHLLNNSNQSDYEDKFKEADIIVAQQVADNYPCKFVTTKILKEKYPSKVISIVNLYFSGYNPELQYIRLPGKGTLQGPMGDYHIQSILDGWGEGLSVKETALNYNNVDLNKELYEDAFHKSINELKRRESNTDLDICTYIVEKYNNRKLFHTMNHPSESLIINYTKLILEKMNVDYVLSNERDSYESLGKFRLPTNPYILNTMGSLLDEPLDFRGVEVVMNEDEGVKLGVSQSYSLEELIQTYFNTYEQHKHLLEELS